MTSETMMNNESNITVDSLSYKELQGLAMSLNLPGKMKQGVLVEAIKARQNHNEQAVTMILEANRQRRIVRRQQQQQMQQQQLLKLNSEKDVNNKRKCPARTRIKRSASEMEMDTFIDEDNFKRSKLAAALIQRRPPAFFSSLTTGATSLTIRKEQQQQYQPVVSGCSTWDQHPINESTVPPPPSAQSLPIIQKPLPDLSKELSILPTLSDCSNSSVATPSSEDLGCCSVGSVSSGASSSWSSMSGNAEQQPLPQSSFEGCDSGWMGSDESYDLNTWKTLPGTMKMSNNNNSSYDNLAPQSSNSSGYFEDNQSTTDMFINNTDMYPPEDFIGTNTSTTAASNYTDYQMPLESSSSNYQDVTIKPDPWCEPFPQAQQQHQPQFQQQQQQQQQQQNQQSIHAALNESRMQQNECCYDVECYQQGGPYFRIQRPGNPTAVFVPSGRSLTLSTFCNMLPRVASYVQ